MGSIDAEVVKIVANQGIWAVLTVFFIFYTLRSQEKREVRQQEREKNYREMLSKLTSEFDIIKNDVELIKSYISKN